MRCVHDPDPATFAGYALPWLVRDPVANNLPAGLVRARAEGVVPTEPDGLWIRVLDDDKLLGVAVRTPPHFLILTAMPPAAIDALAGHAADVLPDLPGVHGPVECVGPFRDRYTALTGRSAACTLRMRLFRLDTVVPPRAVPGRARTAIAADRELILGWTNSFAAEAVPHETDFDRGPAVDRTIATADVWLWERDGSPVAMAWLSPGAAGVRRVNCVYTPPSSRGRGYGTAVVAAASQHALDTGAIACSLFADLTNPTSNKIYQRLGYHPIADISDWAFTQPPHSSPPPPR